MMKFKELRYRFIFKQENPIGMVPYMLLEKRDVGWSGFRPMSPAYFIMKGYHRLPMYGKGSTARWQPERKYIWVIRNDRMAYWATTKRSESPKRWSVKALIYKGYHVWWKNNPSIKWIYILEGKKKQTIRIR